MLSELSSVTERRSLCDETHSADARRTRAPQLCRNDDPTYLQDGGRFPALLLTSGLDQRGPDDIRQYQVHSWKKESWAWALSPKPRRRAAFLLREDTETPGYERGPSLSECAETYPRLPTILTPEEVSRLIDSARNLFHYAMLLTMYSAGLRRSELCKLKVSNIDSGRMVIRIERGKGGVDREVPLNPKLLTTLREYWRWMRPKTYLFPGTRNGWRADKPITPKVIWEAVQHAARKAGIQKHVTPHTLRHALPRTCFEDGAEPANH